MKIEICLWVGEQGHQKQSRKSVKASSLGKRKDSDAVVTALQRNLAASAATRCCATMMFPNGHHGEAEGLTFGVSAEQSWGCQCQRFPIDNALSCNASPE
jgi:cytosine/uracil/thiamine/allantoin permease